MKFKCPLRLLFLSLVSWQPSPFLIFRVVEGRAGLGQDKSFTFICLGPTHLKALSLLLRIRDKERKCLMGKGINVGWEHSRGGIITIVADKRVFQRPAQFAAGKEVVREGGKRNY